MGRRHFETSAPATALEGCPDCRRDPLCGPAALASRSRGLAPWFASGKSPELQRKKKNEKENGSNRSRPGVVGEGRDNLG